MDNLNQHQSSTGPTNETQLTEEDVAAFLAAPLSAESQVELMPAEEVTSNIQQQDLPPNVDDPFINQLLNYAPMFQGLAISNEYPISSQASTETDMGIPNTQIMTSERSTVAPPLQIDPRIPNTQIMTSERSTVAPPPQIHPTMNSHEAWNSRYLQPQAPVPNGHWGQVVAPVPNGHWGQVVAPVQISMPEQPIGIMAHQIPPTNANMVNMQPGKAVVPESSSESSSSRIPQNPFLNIGNQNHVSPLMVPSVPPPNMIPMQNQRQNLSFGNELRREDPNEASSWNLRLIEGRAGQAWDGRLLLSEEGSCSSSKRHKPNSPPNTGLALRPPNSSPENQEPQSQNKKPLTLEDLMSKSLYDPGYEALGLAADPHIRIFLAQKAASQKGYHKFK